MFALLFFYLVHHMTTTNENLMNKIFFSFGPMLCSIRAYSMQGLLNLDGRNSQKYLHQTWANLLTLIISHKLTQSLSNFKKIPF